MEKKKKLSKGLIIKTILILIGIILAFTNPNNLDLSFFFKEQFLREIGTDTGPQANYDKVCMEKLSTGLGENANRTNCIFFSIYKVTLFNQYNPTTYLGIFNKFYIISGNGF